MNFLELTQRLSRECGVDKTGPFTTVNQVGEARRLADWISDANLYIEALRSDWGWKFKAFSFPTVASQAIYTPAQCGITSFGHFDESSIRNYDTAAGIASEIEMDCISYQSWRAEHDLGSLKLQQTRPSAVAVTPDNSIAIGPYPASGYTVTGLYYNKPQNLVADLDVPGMPDQFHMLIVWKAAQRYGSFEAAPEVYQNADIEYKKLMRTLRDYYQKEMPVGGGFA
jgi:hypothetical protein